MTASVAFSFKGHEGEQAPDLRALTDTALPFYRGKHSKAFFQNLDHIVLRQKLISAVRDKHAVGDIG